MAPKALRRVALLRFTTSFRVETRTSISDLPSGYLSILQSIHPKTNSFSQRTGNALIGRVRKKNTKSVSGKKKPTKARKKSAFPALQKRMDAEFTKAVRNAKSYVQNPSRLRGLFDEAAREAESMPKEPFAETWPYFQAMLRLIRAYSEGHYPEVPENTLVVIIAAIIYVVNPLDVIPDALPALGYLDDATVIRLAVRRSRQTLDDFMAWETRTP